MSDVVVYFDYLCPFAWRGAEVAHVVERELELSFEWRHFSLYQSNYRGENGGGNGWQLWNDRIEPESDNGSKGLLPFLASCAARRQGKELHSQFRMALMRARYREHKPYTLSTLKEVAGKVGLHVPKFENDLSDPECRTTLAHEHHRAAALDIFGTPTFCFPNGHVSYFRIGALPRSDEEAVDLFQSYWQMLERYPYLETIKRPRVKGN